MSDQNLSATALLILPRRRHQRRASVKEWLNTAAIALVALIFAFPFIWMFLTALKPENEVFTATPQIFGSEIRWANFVEAWTVVPFGRFILNGLFVAIAGAALSVVVAVLSAYAFSRLRFRFRDKLFLLFVLTLVLPQEVLVVPLFIMINSWGWNDTYGALIIPFAFTAFGTFLMRQFFLTIPIEYEEAALIDGASRIGVFWRIVLPLSMPGLVTVGVLAFVASWNAYLLPLLLLQGDMKTLPLGVADYSSQYSSDTAGVFAFTTLAMIPALVFFLTLQRRIVNGLQGAVKG